jgi:hypothetical protein
MNFFEFLIIGHLAGDFLFQTGWMAREKINNFAALFLHSTIYTFFIGIAALLAGRLTWQALLIVFLGHIFIDNRVFVSLWVKKINRSDENWMVIVNDQCWHLLILGTVVYFF